MRRSAEAHLARALARRPLRRLVLGRLLALVRRGIRHRERARYCRSEVFARCRLLYLDAGSRLAAEGVLAAPEDVFDLTVDEVAGAAAGTLPLRDLRPLVRQRQAELAAAPARPPARREALGAVAARRWSQAEPGEAAPGEAEDTLIGLGSSPGVGRGRARVLTRPDLAGPGGPTGPFVLVARETDPGWLYVMLGAEAVVVERGSLLSHTAIAGRKFGIPTVVGVRDATRRLLDGDLLEVDGSRGLVRRLTPAAVEERAA